MTVIIGKIKTIKIQMKMGQKLKNAHLI